MSAPPTHQTVRLARGKHAEPERGVCVMELASMLADEPFTDHPGSVCAVIAAYLRSYNDVADDAARQDLLALAADAVGTAGSPDLQAARARRCVEELLTLHGQRARRHRLLRPRPDHAVPASAPALERVATELAKLLWRLGPEGHARALALADELISMRDRGSDRAAPAPVALVLA